jgi:hypothetical protein
VLIPVLCSCEDTKFKSGVCLSDSETPIRFYDITVKATDFAGNFDTTQCRVIIVPDSHKVKVDHERNDLLVRIRDSVQRFDFGKQSFVRNGSKETNR